MQIAWILGGGAAITGLAGHFFELPWMFWAGALFCLVAQLLHMRLGTMRSPHFPLVFMMMGGFIFNPWFYGVAFGLIAWTTADTCMHILKPTRTGTLPDPDP